MKENNTELLPALRESQPLAVQTEQPSIGSMLQAVIEKGVTQDNVGALEKLCDLYERMEARSAEREYAEAMRGLQSKMPKIVAKSEIQNRGRYEKFEDIMTVLKPLLDEYGFSIAFNQTVSEGRLCETCKVSHVRGHSTEHAFTVRVGGRSDSETQADCKASTTARRNSLIRAFNIVIYKDCLIDEDDPRNEGSTITPEQAFELERRVNAVSGDVPAFLKLAGAKSYREIMSGKYAMLDAMLAKKEKQGR